MSRRAVLALPLLAIPGLARAERTVRVIVPYPAGGWGDAGARIVFGRLGQRTGQTYVVENRSGAGGQVGSAAVAGAPGDGSMLLYGASSLTVTPALYPRMGFAPLRDLAPVCMVVRGPVLMVAHPSRPERSVRDVIETAKRTPGGLDWASGGVGTTPHLAAALFAHEAGITLNHVTYRGGAPALNDVVAGQVGFLFSTSAVSVPHVRNGVLRGIAHTAAAPIPEVPDLPSMAASLPGFETGDWYAVFAPAAMPQAAVAELNAALNAVMAEPDIRAQLSVPGATVGGGTAAELGAVMESETAKWTTLIERAGIRAS